MPEGNPLDLNNFPDEYSRDVSKQVFEEGSSSRDGYRKKKSGVKDEKDDCGKVYECRFCSLKFCKSQALGGHMNRHRQERETETLNRARQLVFGNDNLAAPGAPHLGWCQPIGSESYHSTGAGGMGDPTLPLRCSRYYAGGSSSSLIPQPPLYSSPSRPAMTFASQYPSAVHPTNDYYVGHVLSGGSQQYNHHHHRHHPNLNYDRHSNYTCIGAPVAQGFNGRFPDMTVLAGIGGGSSNGGSSGRDGSLHSSDQEGLNWGRSSYTGAHQHLDTTMVINGFHQDGF